MQPPSGPHCDPDHILPRFSVSLSPSSLCHSWMDSLLSFPYCPLGLAKVAISLHSHEVQNHGRASVTMSRKDLEWQNPGFSRSLPFSTAATVPMYTWPCVILLTIESITSSYNLWLQCWSLLELLEIRHWHLLLSAQDMHLFSMFATKQLV